MHACCALESVVIKKVTFVCENIDKSVHGVGLVKFSVCGVNTHVILTLGCRFFIRADNSRY